MSGELSDEERKRYTASIDAILATADLETISRKKIRQGLEAAEGRDLDDQKAAIKRLIEERFDAISSAQQDSVSEPESSPKKRAVNGTSPGASSNASPEPPRKKAKRSPSAEEADARLAAQLQAQENKLARGRATRGGDKKPPKKKAARKKSAKKVKASDDSDLEGSDAEKPKRKAGGGFQKPFALSVPLQELTGQTQLSRPHVVKEIWKHIKEHDLQDPNDRRQIICDEKLQAIFKQSKVSMFGMNREIGHHLYPIEEPAEPVPEE